MSFIGEASLGFPVLGTGPDGAVGLRVSRCPQCGGTRFPARPLCPIDLGETDEVLASGKGTVYEIVEVHLAPTGFAAPYWGGHVDLDEGPRVFAQIAFDDDSPPAARRSGHHDCRAPGRR